MSTIALEGLWNYIQSLSLSRQNMQWLEARCHEASMEEPVDAMDFCGIWRDSDSCTTEDIATEIRNSRKFHRSADALFA